MTVQGYGDHPATTIAAAPADPAACRRDATAFAHAARDFLAHSGARAAYPADLWLVLLRESLADYRARGCTTRLPLSRGELRKLVDDLPASMAATVSETFGL